MPKNPIEYWGATFTKAKIEHKSFNKGMHLKVGDWNFYPTSKTYWNEFTSVKGKWKTIEDVKKLIEADQLTPETMFQEVANEMLVGFNYQSFIEKNPRVMDAIVESMKIWRKIK